MATEWTSDAASPEHDAFLQRVYQELDDRSADDDEQAELARIDRIVARRIDAGQSERLVREVAEVGAAAHIVLDVPTDSRIAVGRGVKTGVKRLVRWYVDPLGHQTAVLGNAAASFAAATSVAIEELEGEIRQLRAEVDTLRRRVEDRDGSTAP